MSEVKEKEKKEVKKESPKYRLSKRVMEQGGYVQRIDGRLFVIDYDRDYTGKRISRYATVCERKPDPVTNEMINTQIKPEALFLEDLTDAQLKSLVFAGVVTLAKEQEPYFRKNVLGIE